MPSIKVLPETIANKIAAGEVIERPASVVKELMENSIDAGASQIIVEIRDAGKKLIRVVDNGSGMAKEDAQLAFERHATSKISSADDLFSIKTLGFRGEALPSIAAVSKLQLVTRTKDSLSGIKIEIEGGKMTGISDSGSPIGTTISVHQLFYNTPARLKFLKSDFTEISQITSIVTHLALAYPHISFRLLVDGKENFQSPSVTELRDRVITVLGKDTDMELLSLTTENDSLKIIGFIGRPGFTRKNWFQFLVFVNGRNINNRLINNAVYEGYHGLLMTGRYPVGVLFLQINPSEIDVNVHPTKREIRFLHEKEIQEQVIIAVRNALQQTQLIPEIKESLQPTAISSQPKTISVKPAEFKRPDFDQQVEMALQGKIGDSIPTISTEIKQPSTELKPPIEITSIPKKEESRKRKRISCAADYDESTEDMLDTKFDLSDSHFPELFPLAQLDETYILCRSGDDLLIVDQHAAHERVLFDQLLPKMEQSQPVIQHLLIPVNVELTPRETAILQEYIEDIRSMGLEIDSMGGNTYTIRAVPQLVEHADYRELLLDLLDTFSQQHSRLPTDQLRYKMASVICCRAAIKAGDTQNKSEWQTLVKKLQGTQHPYTCPHGRPTVIRLTKAELEKRFKRTGA